MPQFGDDGKLLLGPSSLFTPDDACYTIRWCQIFIKVWMAGECRHVDDG